MNLSNGALVIAIGLFLLWLAVTNKLDNFPKAWAVLNGETVA